MFLTLILTVFWLSCVLHFCNLSAYTSPYHNCAGIGFFFFFFQGKQVFTCMISATGIKEILWIMYFFISMAKELQIGHRKFVITFIGKDGLYQCSCCNLTKCVCFFIHTVRWRTGPVEPAALQSLLCVLLG